MPDRAPIVGETWELTDQLGRVTRGIVAEISSHRVTLVALTGARIRVPSGRFPEQWHLATAPPVTNLHCSRCGEPGILQFQRGTSPDFTCPRHLPVGVVATIHTLGDAVEGRSAPPRDIIQCPDCGSTNPVEDVRLGRLDRGEFGWWTCTLCSSRWGLISQPPHDCDDNGRWYVDALSELHQDLAQDWDDKITRIELSTVAWRSIRSSPLAAKLVTENLLKADEESVGAIYGIPLYISPSLTDGFILTRAGRAPAGTAIAQRTVRKIGGVAGRDPAPQGTAGTIRDAFQQLYAGEFMAGNVALTPKIPHPSPPAAGERFFQRRTGREVEIVRVEESEGRWSVALRSVAHMPGEVGSSPHILWLQDFLTEYLPQRAPPTAKSSRLISNVPVVIGDEWYAKERSEYIRANQMDEERGIVQVVGLSTGRVHRVLQDELGDETRYTRVVKVTSHERIMGDDDF